MNTEDQKESSEIEELDAIQWMNLERKIAAGIFVVMLAVFGIYYFFLQPTPKKEFERVPVPGEMDTEGEGRYEMIESIGYIIGPPPL